jgi:hypothetical protein
LLLTDELFYRCNSQQKKEKSENVDGGCLCCGLELQLHTKPCRPSRYYSITNTFHGQALSPTTDAAHLITMNWLLGYRLAIGLIRE